MLFHGLRGMLPYMADIKIHAGDFLPGTSFAFFGQMSLKTKEHPHAGETIAMSELQSVEVATEENVKKLAGTVGWGLAGAAALGPLGLLAGAFFGGRKKEVTFIAQLKDGRRMLATTDGKTFMAMQAAAF